VYDHLRKSVWHEQNNFVMDIMIVFGENQLDLRQINQDPNGNYSCVLTYYMYLSGCNIIFSAEDAQVEPDTLEIRVNR